MRRLRAVSADDGCVVDSSSGLRSATQMTAATHGAQIASGSQFQGAATTSAHAITIQSASNGRSRRKRTGPV